MKFGRKKDTSHGHLPSAAIPPSSSPYLSAQAGGGTSSENTSPAISSNHSPTAKHFSTIVEGNIIEGSQKLDIHMEGVNFSVNGFEILHDAILNIKFGCKYALVGVNGRLVWFKLTWLVPYILCQIYDKLVYDTF